MSQKCKRCGACQECGAVPVPYTRWPYTQPVYPQTPPRWNQYPNQTTPHLANTYINYC